MNDYFTNEKIADLVTNHNWELVQTESGKHRLRQKDAHHMSTVTFEAAQETARKFCVSPNA